MELTTGIFRALNGIYEQSCLAKEQSVSPKCRAALRAYRATLTEWTTRRQSLREIDDVAVLVDKMSARFLGNPIRAIEVAERLLEINPKMYSARKAIVLARFYDAVAKPERESGGAQWRAVEDSLSALNRTEIPEPEREGLAQLAMAVSIRRFGDSSDTRNLIDSYRAEHPNSAWGPYFAAWVEAKSGNQLQVIEHLREALRLEPGNLQFQRTLQLVSLMTSRHKMEPLFGKTWTAEFDESL